MRKFRIFIDQEKEEKWLEEMLQKGYHLEDTSFGYKFRKTKPQDRTIKIDYRIFNEQVDFMDYCTLFEDSGWKHIVGNKSSGKQYFIKAYENGNEDIFSDELSRASKYKRLSTRCLRTGIGYLPLFLVLIYTKVINVEALYNPMHLYLNKEIWEMQGLSFWTLFLLETPFAILRGLLWYFFPVSIILYIYFYLKAKKLYRLIPVEK
ncbi:DUF2812 domain-containing protein [Gracilibacillus thailandensis]|uniref:DUF2812 domain-containing protein n=1 Tax=Gracilibacillus thailandensis TaxID=563735 RepID=A0A6N7R5Q1_9BACI|nr:DUF2812 domain-containing protein [Gracilibacillus thailandensis]MRI68460.1 DUF2812 domain-containing protein [Gracilibacillus thailandensis]